MIRGIVYQIKHKHTGKTYVGSTTKCLDVRVRKHWEMANSQGKESLSAFYTFMKQCKYDDFDYSILKEQDYKTKQDLEEDEMIYIQAVEKDLSLNSKRKLTRHTSDAYKQQLARKKERRICIVCNEPYTRAHKSRHYGSKKHLEVEKQEIEDELDELIKKIGDL